jgi:hypothetical protein
MSDQFSRTIRAYAGGANPYISINSVSEAAAHIAALPEPRRQKLHWQLAQRTVEEAGKWEVRTSRSLRCAMPLPPMAIRLSDVTRFHDPA